MDNNIENLCEYCNKKLSSLSALNYHKKSAKYCINIQNKKILKEPETEIIIENNQCEHCSILFSNKYCLNIHYNRCKELKKINTKNFEEQFDITKKENELLKKELYLLKKEKTYFENRSINYKEQLDKKTEEVNSLQNRIEKLALKAIEKPTTSSTHNTIINNLPAFHCQEFINNKIQDKFDDRYFHNEMKSIAQFTYDHILTLDNGNLVYVCSDYGRKNFKYKDKNGNEITDPEAIKLISMIQDKLYDKTCYLHDWAVNEYDYLKMQEERDELKDKKELDNVIDMIGKAQDMKLVIKSMDKTNKFSNELAKLTVIKK